MTGVKQGSLAVLAMTNRFIEVGVQPLKASEVWLLLERVEDPSGLFGLDEQAASDVTRGTSVEPVRLVRLLDAGVGLAVHLEALYERGITPVTPLDEHYPTRLRDRLGPAAPPVLYCAGELALLAVDGVGVVGSRDIGSEAVEVTRKVAHQVAGAGLPLVSGGARGVDSIAMAAAFDAGGTAVGVLADSLQRAVGQSENRRAMLDGRACLCTPYRPDAGFTAGSAMGRNKIVYGLSRVTLVVASAQGEGGTWSGATEALRKRYGRVAVWIGDGRGPGNKALVEAGAAPLDEPEAVLDVDAHEPAARVGKSQMALAFDDGPDANGTTELREQEPAVGVAEVGFAGEGAESPSGQIALPAGALTPQPTGICWCGCGKEVDKGAFFLPRHGPGAVQRAVVKHFGSVEAFLAQLGEVPTTDPP